MKIHDDFVDAIMPFFVNDGVKERIKSMVSDSVTAKEGKIIVAQDSDSDKEEWAKASL